MSAAHKIVPMSNVQSQSDPRQKRENVGEVHQSRIYPTVASKGISSSRSSTLVFGSSPTSRPSLESPFELHNGDEASWFIGQDALAFSNDIPACCPNKGSRSTKIRSTVSTEDSLPGTSSLGINFDSILPAVPRVYPMTESTASSRRHHDFSQTTKSITFHHNMHLLHETIGNIAFNTVQYPNSMMMSRAVTPEVAAQHGAHPPRPKSESIAIKRSREDEDSFQSEHSTERMYDWATWRMYHRITNARRYRISSVLPDVPYKHNSSILRVPAMPPTESISANHDDHTPHGMMSLDYSDQGEVFEIEI